MRFVSKDKLKYVDGYLVDEDGHVIGLRPCIVRGLNEFERLVQGVYTQKEAVTIEDGHTEFQSEHDAIELNIKAKTPLLDEQAKKMAEMFDESAAYHAIKRAEEFAMRHIEALKFIASDTVADTEMVPERLDLLTLGDPLKIDMAWLLDAIIEEFINGAEPTKSTTNWINFFDTDGDK